MLGTRQICLMPFEETESQRVFDLAVGRGRENMLLPKCPTNVLKIMLSAHVTY